MCGKTFSRIKEIFRPEVLSPWGSMVLFRNSWACSERGAQKEGLGGCAHLSSETTNTTSSKGLSLLWRDTETPTAALPYWAESLWSWILVETCQFCKMLPGTGLRRQTPASGVHPIGSSNTLLLVSSPPSKSSYTLAGVCHIGFRGKSLLWQFPHTWAEAGEHWARGLSSCPAPMKALLVCLFMACPSHPSPWQLSTEGKTQQTGADQTAALVGHNHRTACHILPCLLPWMLTQLAFLPESCALRKSFINIPKLRSSKGLH